MAVGLYWKKLSPREKEARRAPRRAGTSLPPREPSAPRTKFALSKSELEKLYVAQGQSMQQVAKQLHCSLHKVSYWMERYLIRKRSRSDAMYMKHNPHGDPFQFVPPETKKKLSCLVWDLGCTGVKVRKQIRDL